MRRRCSWAVAILLACAVAAGAATIKKKDGTTVEGKVLGQVIQKGELEESPSEKHPDKKKYLVSYVITDGSEVAGIDEDGVRQDGRLIVIFVAAQEGSPPEDADVIETGFNPPGAGGPVEEICHPEFGLCGPPLKGGGAVLRVRLPLRGRHRVHSEQLVGQYRQDPATKKGRLEANIEVQTAAGTVKVPVVQIVAFKPKPAGEGSKK